MKTPLPIQPANPLSTLPLSAMLDRCSLAVALYGESPDQPEIVEKLQSALHEAATAIVLLGDADSPDLKAILELQRKLAA